MTKKEFIELYAKNGNMSKKDAEKNINLFLDSIQEALISDNEVGFVGWGKWEVQDKAARNVMNPQTKKLMTIEARRVVKFKPGKLLAEKIK
ncbi:HU family DNA-binding protein [Fusobacterium sp.]|uniref:HU family DNA-binding protein n=1 Tax=Fusobacterium sp. TaxID=68766 RepID=UPI00396C30B2